MRINYFDIYEPLLPGNLPPEVRYVLVMGGRGSAKSFHTSTALVSHAEQDANTILFTRFTMTAANVSIIPEFTEKIDMLNRTGFEIKATEINHARGGKILFRGLMQGSKSQTARLKSIPNVKLFVLDEAEELMSESTFDTIDFSLRKIGVHALLWLVLNPADISHWIYKRFVQKVAHLLKPNTCIIIGDTCYIWTTYEINRDNLDEAFIAQAEKMRETNYEKYENIFLGKWLVRKEGLIFKNWEAISPDLYPHTLPQWYGLDWGYASDPTAIVRVCYDPLHGILYLWQVCYCVGMLINDIAAAIIRDAETIGYRPQDCIIYCDPARPDNRDQLRQGWSLNAVNGENRDKTGRIGYLQGFRVRYVGAAIGNESSTYSWMPNPFDTDTFTDKPQDGNDHIIDAINYSATHLRRMGIQSE